MFIEMEMNIWNSYKQKLKKNIYLALIDCKTNHMMKESMWTFDEIDLHENN